jgi:DNA-directed RNA polymerase specialized sigma24 family protein
LEDRVQDALVRCWQGIRNDAFNPCPEVPIHSSLRAWIIAVTRNRLAEHARWSSRHPEHPPLVGLGEDGNLEIEAIDLRTLREEERIGSPASNASIPRREQS